MNLAEPIDIRTGRPFADRVHPHHREPMVERASTGGASGRARGLLGGLFGGCMMASQSRGWTNPYVTDGLIAMWDGEWNAGGGTHNASATTWANLVGGEGISISSSSWSWGDKFATIPKSANVATMPSFNPLTIEVVSRFITTSDYQVVLLFAPSGGKRWFGIRGNNTVNFSHGGYYCNSTRGDTHSYSASFSSSESSSPSVIYKDGVSSLVLSYGLMNAPCLSYTNSINPYDSRVSSAIYCIRLYSRAITASEVAANYAVDKARFGLA